MAIFFENIKSIRGHSALPIAHCLGLAPGSRWLIAKMVYWSKALNFPVIGEVIFPAN